MKINNIYNYWKLILQYHCSTYTAKSPPSTPPKKKPVSDYNLE